MSTDHLYEASSKNKLHNPLVHPVEEVLSQRSGPHLLLLRHLEYQCIFYNNMVDMDILVIGNRSIDPLLGPTCQVHLVDLSLVQTCMMNTIPLPAWILPQPIRINKDVSAIG